VEPERISEQTRSERDHAGVRDETQASDVGAPDFLAEIDRLWAIDVEDAEMAIRFAP
jgi:hypothetical protein